MNNVTLLPGERLDDLQRNNLQIIQNSEKFCFGIDAVLLSDFATVKRGETVLDIGTGTGIIPILLTAKTEGSHFTGLEIQSESAEMANRSVALNGLENIVDIVEGDINNVRELLTPGSFDVITSNPPYMIGSHGIENTEEPKAIARHEIKCTFDDIVREGSKMLKANGRFYLVHRPFRLVEIFEIFRKYGLEPKKMRLVHPFADKEPNMVLIEAMKGAKPRLTIDKPLVVYDAPGKYTKEIMEIYGYEEKCTC